MQNLLLFRFRERFSLALWAAVFAMGAFGASASGVSPSAPVSRVISVKVKASADIFGQGTGILKNALGGGGTVAPSIALDGATTVTFPRVTGMVSCCGGSPSDGNGPAGGTKFGASEDIQSANGISGVKNDQRAFFLVGVFIGQAPCAKPAPPILDTAKTDTQPDSSPLLCQSFYVGDGKTVAGTPIAVHVPGGATRLVLGFMDGWSFHGQPGYYGDNTGALSVEVAMHAPARPVQAPATGGAHFVAQAAHLALKEGARIPFIWRVPGFGGKLLVLRGTARIDRVSRSLDIIEQGELTLAGPGYKATETFLRTGSSGTGRLTKVFSAQGGKTMTTSGSFTWRRSPSGGRVQMRLVLENPGEPASTTQEAIRYTMANGVMGMRNTSRSSNTISTGTGAVSSSGTGEASAFIWPSSHDGSETASLCDSGARNSCDPRSGYSGPALPRAALAVQTWQMMSVTTWIAFHTPSPH